MLPFNAMNRDLSPLTLPVHPPSDHPRKTTSDGSSCSSCGGIRQRILDGVSLWLGSGRDPAFLPRDWEYLVQSCWVFDHGETQALPAEAHEYILAAGDACGPEKYDQLLQEQGWCGICGESFLFEHLAICADCYETRCRSCMDQEPDGRPDGGELRGSRTRHSSTCSCGGDFVG